MNINTPHKTDKDAKKADAPSLLDEGQYEAVVVAAEDQTSKKGNEMIALQLKVYTKDGRERKVRDWILEAFAVKLRHFAVAAGLEEQYMLGKLDAAMCKDAHVLVDIEVEDTDDYGPQNKVKDYWPWQGKERPKPSGSEVGGYDDVDHSDIPF